jgi:hypothetical protein
MQKSSKALLDLASRVKRVEDSAAAVEARNRAKLQAPREEFQAAIDDCHPHAQLQNAAFDESRTS